MMADGGKSIDIDDSNTTINGSTSSTSFTQGVKRKHLSYELENVEAWAETEVL